MARAVVPKAPFPKNSMICSVVAVTEEKQKWIDDRAQEIIDALPKEPSGLFRFSVPMDKSPYEGLRSDAAGEAYNDLISAVAYAQAEYDWDHRTGCPF